MGGIEGAVRRSQLITTYGVGAIVAVEDESFMIAGIDRWNARPELHEPRLERKLQVHGFVLPPASGDAKHKDIPVVRFPDYYYCPACKRLAEHRFFAGPADNKCNDCNESLVPSRFVMVCENGHIDDFPYFRWVHAQSERNDNVQHRLTIEAAGVSASLSDIIIKCSCGAARSMEGAFGKNALKGICGCSGRRPWLSDRQEGCSAIPRTLQRGASNVYFPNVQSALSIPPWSQGALKIINRYWEVLRHIPDSVLEQTISGMRLAEGTPYKVEDLVLAVIQRKSGENQDGGPSASLRAQEYEALLVGKEEISRDQDFVCVSVDCAGTDIGSWFDRVMSVKRLREVRALCSFTRLLPFGNADDVSRCAPLCSTPMEWLPAIEVQGEGVFLQLNMERLQAWESRASVRARVESINRNYRSRFEERGTRPDRDVTPRLVLIHSLAHVMINQWALDCGYPAGSLRERLFVGHSATDGRDMAGFLIYTATTDAAGSLGGLIAQSTPDRLVEALSEAIHRASWCSADPLCIEAVAAGVDSLNLAACHACLLLPEVSCEENNLLLDRGLLVGTPDSAEVGFFGELLGESQ